MKKATAIKLGGVMCAGAAVAAFFTLSSSGHGAAPEGDPRLAVPVVRIAAAEQVAGAERSFTGVVAAKVQSDLGFRISGKILERMVYSGDQVTVGQPLMRIDDTDLELALTARRNAVTAARAVLAQAAADERRYADLAKNGRNASPQRYEQAKAALDTATAQLEAAEAEAHVAENQATYSVLLADSDGTIIQTLGEPGQVVAAGQTVVRLAHAGPREAAIALPETIRPEVGSTVQASIYGNASRRETARLRQLSDAADAQTRTFDARYILGGDAASAPIGATVTLWMSEPINEGAVQVPLGALLDDGTRTGVWVFDAANSTVHFQPVSLVSMSSEDVVISGLTPGATVVSIGAHLLQDGASVTAQSKSGAK